MFDGIALPDVAITLSQRIDLERQRNGLKSRAFIGLMRERLSQLTPLDADLMPAAARRSLSRFAEAAAAQVGEQAVLAAATGLGRERLRLH